MFKGLFVGLAVVVVLAVIPVVHFVGVPAGPFIAGYFGINAARDFPGTPGRKALIYGVWMGLLVGVMTVIAALVVTLVGDFAYPFLLWGGVVVVTFYYSSMSALGAWYAELRALDRAERGAPCHAARVPGESPAPLGRLMTDALRLLRPLQWVKNGLVFLPFLFAVDIAWSTESLQDVPQLLGSLALLFLGFCALSSGVYVFNDLMDRNADRVHPRKRNRPIASGRVGVPAAFALMACLTAAGLVAMWFAGLQLLLVGAIYLAINVAYCVGGKNVVLLDVFAVASGYVIRAASGALAIDVDPSPWLYTTTGAGALFIVLGRRYAEVRLAGEDAGRQRSVLDRYSEPFISQLLTISATAALLSYTLYTIEAENLPDNNAMLFTLPLVALGLFRYLYLLNHSSDAEAPEQLMVRDLPLLATVVAWLAVSAAVLLLNGDELPDHGTINPGIINAQITGDQMQTQQAPIFPPARTGPSVVAVVATTPETVQDDIARAMELAGAPDALPVGNRTQLKVNISWQHWYPGCSSTPWQIEGVTNALKAMGHTDLVAAHNGTVVVDSYEGEENNKHKAAQDKVGLPAIHLDSPPNVWIDYKPRAEMLALDDIFPEGIQIPETFPGTNIVHLPTMKTHVFTTMTGAMKNAFGGLLHRKRHWTHSVIHETLVDLLAIQQEIHPGLFAVMDGTFAGDGPGPRAMRWHVKNRILASADQVAIDAVAAKMMGFDPMSIPFIRLAHERGLGCGEVADIDVRGEDISNVNWQFAAAENTFASRGQKLIYWGPLKPLENMLLRSPIVGWAFLASNLYHNGYWLKTKGRRRIEAALKTEWGDLFQSY